MDKPKRLRWAGTRERDADILLTEGSSILVPDPGWRPPPPLRRSRSRHFLLSRWNSFGPKIDEDMIRATADLMVELGLRDAG